MTAFALGLLIGFVTGLVIGAVGLAAWACWSWKDSV
jgi:hypothetical protein